MRFKILIASLATAGLGILGVASAIPASAANPFTVVGYGAAQPGIHINEVRSNVHLPDAMSVTPGTAAGVIMAEGPNGTNTALAAAFVSQAPGGCSGDAWTLEWSANGGTVDQPLITPVTVGSPARHICVEGQGTRFVAAHWSTLHSQFAVIESPVEANAPTVALANLAHMSFFNAAVGVDLSSTPANPVTLSFTRNGLTEPAGDNFGGIAGTRVTLDKFHVTAFTGPDGTVSHLPATSSNFSVTLP